MQPESMSHVELCSLSIFIIPGAVRHSRYLLLSRAPNPGCMIMGVIDSMSEGSLSSSNILTDETS